MPNALHNLIGDLENDRSLEQPTRWRERIDALDRIEDLLVYASEETPATTALHERVRLVQTRLEGIQHRLCEAIRTAIVQGAGAQALQGWGSTCDDADPQSYDHLDALISDVLSFDEPSSDIAALDDEMVFYQPTPARHVFDLIERAGIGPHDVLIDLGSGLGHVPLLVSICTGARCFGIEREAAYVAAARRSAERLKLHDVTFIAQDARETDLSLATVFYLYTPFTGSILREVLDRIRLEAGNRAIRIATLGPCTAMVAAEPWLTPVGVQDANRITLFKPR
jgi:predicted RNA methylase